MSLSTTLDRVLGWLRAGYPEGIPQHDYVALLGVLHRRLTRAEIDAIAGDLAREVAAPDRLAAEDIQAMIASQVHESADAESVARVSARLAEGGWPLAAIS